MRSRLRQILFNLLGNAINYTQTGGVHLDLEGSSDQGKSELTFRVTDTVPGISEAEREHLFEPFYHPIHCERLTRSGTGLGLAISRRLAGEQLGGRLELESRPGQGSTFTLHLPIEPIREPGRLPPTEPNPPQHLRLARRAPTFHWPATSSWPRTTRPTSQSSPCGCDSPVPTSRSPTMAAPPSTWP